METPAPAPVTLARALALRSAEVDRLLRSGFAASEVEAAWPVPAACIYSPAGLPCVLVGRHDGPCFSAPPAAAPAPEPEPGFIGVMFRSVGPGFNQENELVEDAIEFALAADGLSGSEPLLRFFAALAREGSGPRGVTFSSLTFALQGALSGSAAEILLSALSPTTADSPYGILSGLGSKLAAIEEAMGSRKE